MLQILHFICNIGVIISYIDVVTHFLFPSFLPEFAAYLDFYVAYRMCARQV